MTEPLPHHALLVVSAAAPLATAHTPAGMDALYSPALGLVLAERIEQIEKHGHDAAHDDLYVGGELLSAADAYSLATCVDRDCCDPRMALEAGLANWPWTAESFRPSGEIEMLAKAGALILAELDRVIRARALLEAFQ